MPVQEWVHWRGLFTRKHTQIQYLAEWLTGSSNIAKMIVPETEFVLRLMGDAHASLVGEDSIALTPEWSNHTLN